MRKKKPIQADVLQFDIFSAPSAVAFPAIPTENQDEPEVDISGCVSDDFFTFLVEAEEAISEHPFKNERCIQSLRKAYLLYENGVLNMQHTEASDKLLAGIPEIIGMVKENITIGGARRWIRRVLDEIYYAVEGKTRQAPFKNI